MDKMKCGRCGNNIDECGIVLVRMSYFDSKGKLQVHEWRLCEQCATTLMEVIADGEIV